MDEIISMILGGCELARRLENNILIMASQPDSLSQSCSEIIRAFTAVQERLGHHPSSFSDQVSLLREEMGRSGILGIEEWLRANSTRDMDQRVMEGQHHPQHADLTAISNNMIYSGQNLPADSRMVAGARGTNDNAAGPSSSRTVEGSGELQAGRSESSSRARIRNARERQRTVRVAAPRIGNSEITPEDGFTWRKYGQKEILGAIFPRAYFRCTHQKMYHCPAKKLVQRLGNDPDTFEVTYRSEHTCHMSSTAPGPSIIVPTSPPTLLEVDRIEPEARINMLPIIPPAATGVMSSHQQQHSTATIISLGTWLSMGIGPTPASTITLNNPNTFLDQPHPQLFGSLLGGDAGGSGSYQPVLEMVDAMFNYGNTGDTSMDQIFPSVVVRIRNGSSRVRVRKVRSTHKRPLGQY